MTFELPQLPYGFDSLAPHIDVMTMEIHHGKHHAGYAEKLNAALEKHPELQKKSLNDLLSDIDSLPDDIRTAVRNNGGGHANHKLFWSIMTPEATGLSDALSSAINNAFGSLENFKSDFTNAALSQFGSGWAWLTIENKELHICSTPNQDSPLMKGNVPILGLDVWEHAYYLQYQNRRKDYIDSWWNVVNWDEVSKLYENEF